MANELKVRTVDEIIIELAFIENYEIKLQPEDVQTLNFYINATFPEMYNL